MAEPLVSVVMAVCNGERYLREAIDSVLNQTLQGIEYVVVDDGSTDSTGSILKGYGQALQVISQPNHGLAQALNRGLVAARGHYIARMDADDVAEPERLEAQVRLLEKNPEVGVVGSAVRFIDAGGKAWGVKYFPASDVHIRWHSLFLSPFAHPAVMMRRNELFAADLWYREEYPSIEDYDLWGRLLARTQGANLSRPLLRYRIHSESISSKTRLQQRMRHDRIAFRCIGESFPTFAISQATVSAICRMLIEGDPRDPTAPARSAELVQVYLDLWDQFFNRYHGSRGILQARDDACLRAAVALLRPRAAVGTTAVLRRLLRIDPALPFQLVAAVPMGIAVARRRPFVAQFYLNDLRG
jgi:hypothetical protein